MRILTDYDSSCHDKIVHAMREIYDHLIPKLGFEVEYCVSNSSFI